MSEGDWTVFLDAWNRYKVMCRLRNIDAIRNELRSACTPAVNKMLVELIGPTTLNGLSEDELLANIKRIAVHGVHKEVHRQRFTKISQHEGEPLNQFVARLKAQAELCQFQVVCSNPQCGENVNYGEEMVTQQMISGLTNADYQAKILSEAANITTFQQKFDRLASLESTEYSASHLKPPPANQTSSAAAQKSLYKRASNNRLNNPPKQPQSSTKREPYPCKGCGKTSHFGKSMRREDCPAFNKNCSGCGILGHFKVVCYKAKSKSASAASDDHTEDHINEDEQAYQQAVSFAFGGRSEKSEGQGFRLNDTNTDET